MKDGVRGTFIFLCFKVHFIKLNIERLRLTHGSVVHMLRIEKFASAIRQTHVQIVNVLLVVSNRFESALSDSTLMSNVATEQTDINIMLDIQVFNHPFKFQDPSHIDRTLRAWRTIDRPSRSRRRRPIRWWRRRRIRRSRAPWRTPIRWPRGFAAAGRHRGERMLSIGNLWNEPDRLGPKAGDGNGLNLNNRLRC